MKITLAAARKNAGLTQEAAAKELGVAASTLKRWETGQGGIKIGDFCKLCNLYGCELTDIRLPKM